MQPINLARKLARFDTHWDPHVIADYNDNDVMVARFKGAFPWHKHATTDDFFLVLEGEITIRIEGEAPRTVRAGEVFVVPRGVVHSPVAQQEALVLLIQPKGSPNTGDSDHPPSEKKRI